MNAASDLETQAVAVVHEPKTAVPIIHNDDSKASTQIADYDRPTDEELAILRRVSGKIPWAAYTIAFIELCERFSYYGTTAVCMFGPRLKSPWLTDIHQLSTLFNSPSQQEVLLVQANQVNQEP